MMDIAGQVQTLVSAYETENPLELCACLDISVLDVELPKKLRGFYSNILGQRIIYLSRALTEPQRREVCAHELGHALLHPKLNTMFLSKATHLAGEKYEWEADYFAACLLIPDSLFEEETTVEEIAARSGVSKRLVQMRADKLARRREG